MTAVCQEGMALAFTGAHFRNEPEMIFTAVRGDPRAIRFVHPILRHSRKFILETIENASAFVIGYAEEEFHEDKGVIMAAIQKDGAALQFATRAMREDIDVCFAAAATSDAAPEFAAPWLEEQTQAVADARAAREALL